MKELDIELWEVNYSNVFLTFPFKKEEPLLYMVRDHLMIYSYDGEMEICQGSTSVTIHLGECVFARKNHKISIIRKSEDEEPFCVLFFVFDRSFLRKYFNDVCKSQINKNLKDPDSNKLIFLKPSLHIDSFFQSMIPYLNSAAQPSKEMIGFKLHEAIHFLLSEDIRVAASLFDFVEPWKVDLQDFMNENYLYDLSSSEIASFTGRSLATFKRDFRKISELSPQKWIIHKRLEEARKLILEDGKKVSDIYLEVGFKSLSHFSQAYKKQYGKAPTQ